MKIIIYSLQSFGRKKAYAICDIIAVPSYPLSEGILGLKVYMSFVCENVVRN